MDRSTARFRDGLRRAYPLAAGQTYTTVEFKLNWSSAVTPADRELRCEGRVLQFGSRIATSEGFVRDAAGNCCARHRDLPGHGGAHLEVIVPSITGTQWPAMVTRGPRFSHHNSPPRGETCRANSFALSRRPAQ